MRTWARAAWSMTIVSVAAAATTLAQPGGGEQQGPPPAQVRVGLARTMELQDRWNVVGRLREVRRVVVSAEQQGRLVEVNAEEGSRVVGGQTVLARIEDVWATLALQAVKAQQEQARATVAEASAKVDQEARDLGYLEELARAGSAKPREVDDQRTSLESARAMLAAAEAALHVSDAAVERVGVEVQKLNLIAPFDGVVVRKMVEIGQYVTRGDQVAEIISSGPIDAVIDVPERLVTIVQLDMSIEVTVEPLNRTFTGRVAAIVPDASNAARTFPVKVRLDDEGGLLKSGMSVTARIPTTELVPVMTVPRDAVLLGPTGATVWVAVNGAAMPVSVQVLFGHEDRFAVRVSPKPGMPGVEDGSQVIIEGGERLMFPGQPLAIQNAAEVAPLQPQPQPQQPQQQ